MSSSPKTVMDQPWQRDHQAESDDDRSDGEEPVYQVLQTAPFIEQGSIDPVEDISEILFTAPEDQTAINLQGKHFSSTETQTQIFTSKDDETESVTSLDNHEKEHFVCQLCTKSFSTKSHLLEHLQNHCKTRTGTTKVSEISRTLCSKNREKFCCEMCGKTYTTSSNLYKHAQIHTGVKYKCSSCPKSFRYKETLKRHKESHSKSEADVQNNSVIPTSFKCPYCQEVLPSKLRLAVHLRKHPFEKPYKCDVCGRTFSQQTGCVRHRLTHSTNRPHVCSTCGKGFVSKETLRAHLKSHSSRRPFTCGKCDKSFALKRTLIEHEKLHTDVRTHWCQYCGKGFRQRSTLWGHENIHKRKEMHKCGSCDECFGTSQELVKHKKKHWKDANLHIKVGDGGKKLLTCEECGDSFAQKSVLQTHMRRHSGEMPFKCKQCGRQFRHLASHRRHLMIHTGIKPFKCDSCDMTFTKKSYLEGHLAKCPKESHKDLQQIHEALFSAVEKDSLEVPKSVTVNPGYDDPPNISSSCSDLENEETLPQSSKTGQQDVNELSEQSEGSFDSSEKCQILNHQTSSPGLQGNETSVDSDNVLADRVIVSFQDVFDVPINEECVETANLLEHVMQLTQIVQEHVDKAQDSLEDIQGCDVPCGVHVQHQQIPCAEGECNQREDSGHILESKIHASTKRLVCELCGRMYNSHSSLLRHRRSHTSPKPHKCDLCSKAYSRRPLLQEHIQFAHGDQSEQSKRHVCGYCHQAFPNATRLALHVRTHTGDRPYNCGTCQKTFSDRSNLLRHERTHKGIKYHRCMHCDITFVEKSALNRHLKRHEGKKNFLCMVCQKTFASNADLRCHSYVHMPAKEPECPLCGLMFEQEVRFRQHQAKSKRTVKRCRICKNSFASDCIRRQHEIQEHKFLMTDSEYSCGVCGVHFTKRNRLVGHIRNHSSFTKSKKNNP